ncbi:hypothetical protein FRC07_008822, partial [Ceratobasidium sp. 392]
MIELLRKHRERRDSPQSVMPTCYTLLPGEPAGFRSFTKGVLTRAVKRPDELIDQIQFYQLPCKNKGTEFKHWRIDLGVALQDFLIDPDQDLLVGFEPMDGSTFTCRVQLRSMRANNDHPKAAGPLVITSGIFGEDGYPRAEVIGSSLAIFYWFDNDYQVEIWNWMAGQQVSYLDLSGRMVNSAQLLSEHSLVMIEQSLSETNAGFPKDPPNRLNVYQFGPRGTMPVKAIHTASFALPSDKRASVRCQVAPSTNTSGCGHSVAKVYDTESQDRLIYVSFATRQGHVSYSLSGFCTPVSTLLGALPELGLRGADRLACALVPWADWASRASWIFWEDSNVSANVRFFGQRSVSLLTAAPNLTVLDFRKRRLTTWRISPDGAALTPEEARPKQVLCCTSVVQADEEYPEAVWRLRSKNIQIFEGVDIDDSHVIVIKVLVQSVFCVRTMIHALAKRPDVEQNKRSLLEVYEF